MQFPGGDTLGVVFSFLSTLQLLQRRMFIVCKDWNYVLCKLPHAWGGVLNLSWAKTEPTSYSTFAWSCIHKLVLGRATTDTWLSHIICLPLRSLDLKQGHHVTDAGLVYLKSLPLQYFRLSHSSITNAGLSNFTSMPLRYLCLISCQHISDKGLVYIISLSLEHLDLSFCMNILDPGLTHISSMPLKMLSLKYTGVTDIGLAYISSPMLKHLDLGWCAVTDSTLARFSSLPLQYLDIAGSRVTDACLQYIKTMPLKYLDLTQCANISVENRRWFPQIKSQ